MLQKVSGPLVAKTALVMVMVALFGFDSSVEGRQQQFVDVEKRLFAWQKGTKNEKSSVDKYQEIRRDLIEIYRENPSDDIAFKAIMYVFFSQLDPVVKEEQFKFLIEHHKANPDVANLLVGPIVPTVLTPEYVRFFEAFISDDAPVRSRASTMVALAQSFDAVLNAQLSLKMDEKSSKKLLEEKLKSLGGGVDVDSATENFLYWMSVDPEWLKHRIQLLATEVVEKYADVDLQYFSHKGGIKPIAKAGQLAQGLLKGFSLTPGKPAPDLSLTTLDGKSIRLSDYIGKVVMLDFWATWCVPCVEAMPGNRELMAAFAEYPFELITLSVDADMEDVHDFLDENAMPFINTYIGPESSVLSDWNVSSYPTVYIIDAQGNIGMRHSGGAENLKLHLKEMLESTLEKQEGR